MPAPYKTPGVYVEEISTLPPSVAEVSTAIPVFLGYTKKGANTIARVSTMLEYEEKFGGPKIAAFGIEVSDPGAITVTCTPSKYALYHAVNHYFQNGGGLCYIVSLGGYDKAMAAVDFTDAITALEKEDEPTLLVLGDAVALDAADYHSVCQAALTHCKKMGDRFAILDVKQTPSNTDPAVAFRSGIGTNNLAYGAAYHPYVQTTLTHAFDEGLIDVKIGTASAVKLETLRESNTTLYQQIKKLVSSERITLAPSAAMAGVYASVDRDRGVWKAPANVSLSSVIGPTTKITNEDQDSLNVDATSGKSINAIRAFVGKGTLVWGARTLAGNDNEWRYIPVRRLFIMIEESARKATNFAVFEPNDMGTWLKVKGMIESFLYGLWERGALAGSTPEAAYFVDVGLGKTMTAQDVLEGRMIVKIGVAAVRPAEFIVLQFSHKLQEA